MALVRINICCGPRLKDNNWFFRKADASEEVIFTQEDHGLAKIPDVGVYDLDGNEFEPAVFVDDETFEIIVRQEAPAIPFFIALN